MKRPFSINIILLLFIFILQNSCTTKAPQVLYSNYSISKTILKDSNSIKLIEPYKTQLGKSLKEVIGFSANGLFTRKGESAIGNYMADAIKTMAEKRFNTKVTAAFINSGGIRSYLPKGEITVEQIFDIMPFDNLIILQEVNGKTLLDFLNHAAEKGGWPVSKGLTYSIKEGKLLTAEIDGNPIDENAIYTIVNSDYVVNGGDNTKMLNKIPKKNINYLVRDAIIDYTKWLTQTGKTIDTKIENRIKDVK
ncbi:MAG: 5'-nucleotidase C-terminal domain-containing protein [Chitinophagaceae bacterium]|nr:5'-nucleotidase C-terminal domain-containing protein [Chitinophagaceae bacterium]